MAEQPSDNERVSAFVSGPGVAGDRERLEVEAAEATAGNRPKYVDDSPFQAGRMIGDADPFAFDEAPADAPPAAEPTRYELTAEEREMEEYARERFGDQGLDVNDERSVALEAGDYLESEQAREDLARELVDRHPAVMSDAAQAALAPLIAAVREEHGEAVANDPGLIGSLYQGLGGDARFADAHWEEEQVAGILRTGQAAEASGFSRPAWARED